MYSVKGMSNICCRPCSRRRVRRSGTATVFLSDFHHFAVSSTLSACACISCFVKTNYSFKPCEIRLRFRFRVWVRRVIVMVKGYFSQLGSQFLHRCHLISLAVIVLAEIKLVVNKPEYLNRFGGHTKTGSEQNGRSSLSLQRDAICLQPWQEQRVKVESRS